MVVDVSTEITIDRPRGEVAAYSKRYEPTTAIVG